MSHRSSLFHLRLKNDHCPPVLFINNNPLKQHTPAMDTFALTLEITDLLPSHQTSSFHILVCTHT